MEQEYDSEYSILYAIYKKLGGTESNFDSVYSILLKILPLSGGGSENYWTVSENFTLFPMSNDLYNDIFEDNPMNFIAAYIWYCATDRNLEYMRDTGNTVYSVHSNILMDLVPMNVNYREHFQDMWERYVESGLETPDFYICVYGVSPIDDIDKLTVDYSFEDYEINWAIDADKLPAIAVTKDLLAEAPENGRKSTNGKVPNVTPAKPYPIKKFWRKEVNGKSNN